VEGRRGTGRDNRQCRDYEWGYDQVVSRDLDAITPKLREVGSLRTCQVSDGKPQFFHSGQLARLVRRRPPTRKVSNFLLSLPDHVSAGLLLRLDSSCGATFQVVGDTVKL